MEIDKKVSLTLSISKEYRDVLRTMAALQILENPDLLTSASTIAAEIISEYIDKNGAVETDLKAAANAPNLNIESEQCNSTDTVDDK